MQNFCSKSALLRTITVLLLLLTPALHGCSLTKKSADTTDQESPAAKTADELAQDAMQDFSVANYHDALKKFEEIVNRYPFSPMAALAELKSADCQYYLEKYAEAKLLYQEFRDRHPTNEAIPYVMFQEGMCDLNQTDRIDRNIVGARDAIQAFTALVRAFPDSPYTSEANARIRAAREFLINHEMYVAVFYVRAERYPEAVHRLKFLLRTYPDATIAPKAKHLLQRLEAGDPPRLGLNRWIPELTMPDYKLFGSDRQDKQAKTAQQPEAATTLPAP